MPAPKDPIERLIAELSKLPGIGRKSATRLAFHILKEESEYAASLARAISDAKERVGFCKKCFNYATEEFCPVCTNPRRDPAVICVVEQVPDLMAIDAAGGFGGLFHVLHGVLSPLDSVGPEKLRIAELFARLDAGEVREVILATGTGVEGEATALYLAEEIRARQVAVSRIAYGVPIGGELEYIDRATLTRALEGRTRIG